MLATTPPHPPRSNHGWRYCNPTPFWFALFLTSLLFYSDVGFVTAFLAGHLGYVRRYRTPSLLTPHPSPTRNPTEPPPHSSQPLSPARSPPLSQAPLSFSLSLHRCLPPHPPPRSNHGRRYRSKPLRLPPRPHLRLIGLVVGLSTATSRPAIAGALVEQSAVPLNAHIDGTFSALLFVFLARPFSATRTRHRLTRRDLT